MFISFFGGKVMLFFGISLIMKEKSNASALPSAASSATFGRKQQIFSGNEMTLQT